MKKIEFAEGLSLPDDVATQTLGFIARKGAGKSFAAGKLCEGLYAHGDQFVVISPLPNWFGLRLAADGKKPGLDVVILGGLRGDIPLDSGAGVLVADAILDSGRSFVLDVSQFSLSARKRFVTAFGEQLWQRQKALEDPRPIHVVLEEAQLFLPQFAYKGDEHMVGIWNEIVRLGRNCGIGVSLITQRPQSVAKEALTQVECLVVLQVNGVPEKKALKEWIVEKGAKTDLLEELPFLKRGVAYIWSPQWLEHFGKHEILPKWTFDSGATPKSGKPKVKAELKPLDLDALKLQMAETVKRLEANDPSALRRRVQELERELKGDGRSVVAADVVRQMQREFEHMHKSSIARFKQELQAELNNVQKFMASWQSEVTVKMPAPEQHGVQQVFTLPKGTHPPREHVLRNRIAKQEANGASESTRIRGGARGMLRALASREPNALTRNQMATLAGLSSSSGTFSTYLSALRTAGLIDDSTGLVQITPLGLAELGESVPKPQSTGDLVDQWKEKFPGKVGSMLQELVDRFPKQVSKAELGEIVGISHTSGTYSTYLSKLRSNGLVTVDRQSGQLKASEDLFL
jgi:hypothetical protein